MKSDENPGYDLGKKFFKNSGIFQGNIGGYQKIGIEILATPERISSVKCHQKPSENRKKRNRRKFQSES